MRLPIGIYTGCPEALIRLPNCDGTLIPPLVFIPVAEELQLIGSIGAWVLREACRTAVTWPSHLRLAVNLSPAQFTAVGISSIVATALRESHLEAHRLELEITESLLLGKCEATIEELRLLKSMGIAIVMDDFGTGYSSLSYLWRFPFDKIKIDHSFLQEFDNSGQDAKTVLRTMIALARELHMRVTVEGVETERQLAFLEEAEATRCKDFFLAALFQLLKLPPLLLRTSEMQSPASRQLAHQKVSQTASSQISLATKWVP